MGAWAAGGGGRAEMQLNLDWDGWTHSRGSRVIVVTARILSQVQYGTGTVTMMGPIGGLFLSAFQADRLAAAVALLPAAGTGVCGPAGCSA